MARSEDRPDGIGNPDPTVGELAELYLGNILYALERCAMSFDDEGSAEHAAFYRGIARKLAEAHGRKQRA
jgi:hypothetical protein